MAKKRKGRSAAFMRSINPNLRNKRKVFKRRSSTSSMAKKRKSSRKRSSSFSGGLMGIALGIGGYILYDALLKPMIPISGLMLTVAEMGLGAFLYKKNGFLGKLGLVMLVLNGAILVNSFVSPYLNNGAIVNL